MPNALETSLNVLVSLTLLALLLGPEIVWHRRERRIDRQLRDAERGTGTRHLTAKRAEAPSRGRIAVHLTRVADHPACGENDTCTAA